jgi:hypothetical protein
MIDLSDLRGQLAAQVAASSAGLPATLDPRNIQAPCVVIGPAEPRMLSFDGTAGTFEVAVSIVAPPPGNADAWHLLETAVCEVMRAVGAHNADAGTYEVGGAAYPAYLMTVSLSARGTVT